MAYKRKTEKLTTPPAQIDTPEDRGLALRVWLNIQGINVSDFAKRTGIGRATINRYLAGLTDLANIDTSQADRLLTTMGISDEEAWHLLGIPEEARRTFRSLRPWPLGGQLADFEDAAEIQIQLTETLFGSVPLPAGALLRISRNDQLLPHLIYQLQDGRLFSVERNSGVQPGGQLLGGLSSVHFASAESDPQPSTSDAE